MTKILSSKWFFAVVAVIVFGATMVVLAIFQKPVETTKQGGAEGTNVVANGTNAVAGSEHPDQPAPSEPTETHESTQPTAPATSTSTASSGTFGEPGSVSFNNPDIKILVDELKQQKAALLAERGKLTELARRLALEKAEIASITQKVLEAKSAMMAELTNQMNIRDTSEEARIRDLAKVYTNMSAASAVQILDGMSVDDVAQILFFMAHSNQAQILENFATNSVNRETGKATEISEKIRKLAERPKLSSNR